MNKKEFRGLIREEIKKVLNEATAIDPALKVKLKSSLAARKRDPEDENAYNELKDVITQIYKKAGRKDAESLVDATMEDESTLTGTMNDVLSVIKDMLSEPASSSKNAPPIYDSLGQYQRYDVKPKGSQTEIIHFLNFWTYLYAGTPDEMYTDLINANAIHKSGNKYREKMARNDDALTNAIKANKKFKKVK